MKKRRPIRLTPADAEAVLAALPLVVEFEADTARQQTINESIAFSVSQKLVRSDFRFHLQPSCRILLRLARRRLICKNRTSALARSNRCSAAFSAFLPHSSISPPILHAYFA